MAKTQSSESDPSQHQHGTSAKSRHDETHGSNTKTAAPKSQASAPSPQITLKQIPPMGQFAINFVLQILAIAAGVAFGVFAVKSVRVGNQANRIADQGVDLALIANKLTILTLCLSNNNVPEDVSEICSEVTDRAISDLSYTASVLFPATTPTSAPPPKSAKSLEPGLLSGIIIGVIFGVIILVGGWFLVCIRFRRRRKSAPSQGPEVESSERWIERNTVAETFRRLFVETRVVPVK